MVTSGALPKAPLTFTAEAAWELEEEPPHPASTPTASRGRAVRTAIRRMGRKPCRRRLSSSAEAPPAYRAGLPRRPLTGFRANHGPQLRPDLRYRPRPAGCARALYPAVGNSHAGD